MTVTAVTRLEPIFEPVIEQAGFRLVRLRMMGGSGATLQVMAERPDGSMDVEGCTELSRALLDFIEQNDPIEGEYELEVSSPGIDRPLTRRADYADWAGHEARVKFAEPVDGAKQVSGDIVGIDGETVTISTPKGERSFPFSNIASAKLLLTDKLINATAPLSTEGADQIKTEG